MPRKILPFMGRTHTTAGENIKKIAWGTKRIIIIIIAHDIIKLEFIKNIDNYTV